VIAEATTSFTEPVTVTAELGLRGGGTWYARHGDVFAWLCALGAALLLAWRGWRTGVRAAG
jgi:apolipoprotein N-acyltransferase